MRKFFILPLLVVVGVFALAKCGPSGDPATDMEADARVNGKNISSLLAWDYSVPGATFQVYERLDPSMYDFTTPIFESTPTSFKITRKIDNLKHCFVVRAIVDGVHSDFAPEVCRIMKKGG